MGPSNPKREIPQSPKGMHDIIGDEYYRYQGFFEKAQEIALYYGFQPIETPVLEPEDLFIRGVGEHTEIIEKEMYSLKTKGGDKLVMRPEGTAPIMRAYHEHGMHTKPQPVMLYYFGSYFRHEKPQRGRLRQFRQFGLEILGTNKSISDAIIIRSTLDILEEVGFKNLCIDINSIGDAESRPSYIRALTNYYKKHFDNLCVQCKERLKNNPLRLLDCKSEKCAELKESAPDSISHLSTRGKKHFREVMEYLDDMNITYQLNKELVRGLDYYTDTVFEIYETQENEEETTKKLALAGGGRYDRLSKALGMKKVVPGVGVGIGVERIIEQDGLKNLTPRIIKKPKVYFIQLGFEAKLKSLHVIEMLRKARIPIAQSLSKDSLSGQLGTAESLGVPYAVIFGQKEAMDGTVIVRNMKNRSQETVPLEKLSEHLKKIK